MHHRQPLKAPAAARRLHFATRARSAATETVGQHLVSVQASAVPGETFGELRRRLTREKPAAAELVIVTDAAGTLAGVIPASELFSSPDDARVQDFMHRDFPVVTSDLDQESAASLALHHRVDALPVVDDQGRPMGLMPSHALLQTLRREHVEDLHVLAGIQRETAQARHAIEDPPMRRARHRLPWLLFGLAGSALATWAMTAFETTLRIHLAVAFFVPAIVYLADAVGTQSEAIAVRGLSLTRAGLAHLLWGELRTGMLLGIVLGTLAFPAVYLAFGQVRLAAAVAIAVFAAATVASAIGLGLPWLFSRLGRDPAMASGPIGTVIQDILSLCIYLLVVRALLA